MHAPSANNTRSPAGDLAQPTLRLAEPDTGIQGRQGSAGSSNGVCVASRASPVVRRCGPCAILCTIVPQRPLFHPPTLLKSNRAAADGETSPEPSLARQAPPLLAHLGAAAERPRVQRAEHTAQQLFREGLHGAGL